MYYRVWVIVRVIFILLAAATIIGAVAFRMSEEDYANAIRLYNSQLTVVVGTAIADALNNATRTAEAPLKQYRLIAVSADQTLEQIAEDYGTTVEIIRRVNALAPDVVRGDGSLLIIPQGVTVLDPPRRLIVHEARLGDSLQGLAQQFEIPLRIILEDNPVLAERELIPGDIVFIAEF